jgi:uncharacterized protein (TIGR00730 family)
VVMPGGFGTMDEMFEVVTLVQTHKIPPMPIILVGRAFWQGLLDWVVTVMDKREHYISPGDINLFTVVDTVDEAMAALAHVSPDSRSSTFIL